MRQSLFTLSIKLIATLPGLWNRTITVNSGGKMFCNTGWRIGWIIAPDEILWPMSTVLGRNIISVSTPMQIAFAMALEYELQVWNTPQSYIRFLRNHITRVRNKLLDILNSIGAEAIPPKAGYFILANFTNIINKIDLSNETDKRPGMKIWNAFIKQAVNK